MPLFPHRSEKPNAYETLVIHSDAPTSQRSREYVYPNDNQAQGLPRRAGAPIHSGGTDASPSLVVAV